MVSQTTFERWETQHRFEVVRIWEQPAEQFQVLPGLLPFAVLGQTNDSAELLRQVSGRIETIEEHDSQADVAASAALLAGLVLDKQLIRSILREDVMKESVIYQDIVATAKEIGRSEGKQEGRQEGRQEGELSLVLRLLRHRFGTLTPDLKQQVEHLPLTTLEELGEVLLDVSDKVELLEWLRHRQ